MASLRNRTTEVLRGEVKRDDPYEPMQSDTLEQAQIFMHPFRALGDTWSLARCHRSLLHFVGYVTCLIPVRL